MNTRYEALLLTGAICGLIAATCATHVAKAQAVTIAQYKTTLKSYEIYQRILAEVVVDYEPHVPADIVAQARDKICFGQIAENFDVK